MHRTQTGSAPAHVPAHLVRHLDVIADPAVTADPYGCFDRLRAESPILYSTALGGFWLVLGADEVREVFLRTDDFGNYPTGVPPMAGFWPRKLIPQELDGDEHRRFRRLLLPFFSPAAIAPVVTSVRRHAERLVRDFTDPDGGEFVVEFIGAFANPLPTTVFVELFGLPPERGPEFATWSWDLLHSGDPARSAEVGGQIVGFLVDLIARRRRTPGDDLISALVRAEPDGTPLSDEDLLDTSFLLFIAGMDTVTSQLGVLFHHLATHPEQQHALRADPALVPAALDELLRAFPIVPPARTLTRDAEIGGVTMRAGDTVLVGTSGASRDVAGGDGHEVRFDRGEPWNTAFGLGAHRCLGVHLARHELQIALELVTTLAPPFRPAPGTEPRMRTIGNVWGYDALPLVFDGRA